AGAVQRADPRVVVAGPVVARRAVRGDAHAVVFGAVAGSAGRRAPGLRRAGQRVPAEVAYDSPRAQVFDKFTLGGASGGEAGNSPRRWRSTRARKRSNCSWGPRECAIVRTMRSPLNWMSAPLLLALCLGRSTQAAPID